MNNIKYSPEAENDLVELKDYISSEYDNPDAATRIVAMITKRIRDLQTFPKMGANLSSIIGIDTEYRYIVCEEYIAFYRFDECNVYIIRILHGQRDYLKILFGNPLHDR